MCVCVCVCGMYDVCIYVCWYAYMMHVGEREIYHVTMWSYITVDPKPLYDHSTDCNIHLDIKAVVYLVILKSASSFLFCNAICIAVCPAIFKLGCLGFVFLLPIPSPPPQYRPVLYLPALDKPTVIVRCCPIYFELRTSSQNESHPPPLFE